MDYEKLEDSLIYFIDPTFDDEEVADLMRDRVLSGRSDILERYVNYISEFIESNPDRRELRDFVAYKMNRDFNDPTYEKDFQWLVSARDLIQSVLEETQPEHQSQALV